MPSENRTEKAGGSKAPSPPLLKPPLPFVERRRSMGPAVRAVRFEVAPSTLITLVLVIASLWLLIRLAPILLVLVVALLIVGTMSPVVRWLEARRVRRGAFGAGRAPAQRRRSWRQRTV